MSERCDWPFLNNDKSIEFLRSYGRVMFITRGLPGSGKSGIAEAVKETYPSCKIIRADQMFVGFGAVEKTPETTIESHLRCQENDCGTELREKNM
ncbi:hypothetical protein V5799_012780 [Amblyomma americanum]|uniref:2',3'-cyclic-nucleotide 3'-phosphodiesterase n=1 Tax=Amblyomma americanum TaxID=6943 RepID=A0AAQ4E7X0_AMBAM